MQTPLPPVSLNTSNGFRGVAAACRITGAAVFALLLLALAGCASTIDAKVTRFNQWPADATGQTFSFTAPAAGRELELRAYQTLAARELQTRGLVPSPEGRAGRFLVDVQASQDERQRTQLVPVYVDDWVYVPAWRDPSRHYGGYWVQERFGSRYVGDREVTRTVQASELRLRISDQGDSTGKTVFDASAVQESPSDDLAEVMPFLMQGIFQDFPGANGQVRRMRFELPKR
ncbi:DUF4136 domain-containing protein [Hydrogenophaga sp.]|uniref:DUF4136 domain-containing protein n=1 Tax=Hydrogenophaga sp. TaxID=1904254 RepID=UPI0025C4087E|nr:DUF4136 domain-containing protein [Hydrogenophaga sp.]